MENTAKVSSIRPIELARMGKGTEDKPMKCKGPSKKELKKRIKVLENDLEVIDYCAEHGLIDWESGFRAKGNIALRILEAQKLLKEKGKK